MLEINREGHLVSEERELVCGLERLSDSFYLVINCSLPVE